VEEYMKIKAVDILLGGVSLFMTACQNVSPAPSPGGRDVTSDWEITGTGPFFKDYTIKLVGPSNIDSIAPADPIPCFLKKNDGSLYGSSRCEIRRRTDREAEDEAYFPYKNSSTHLVIIQVSNIGTVFYGDGKFVNGVLYGEYYVVGYKYNPGTFQMKRAKN
jgi:hypothetical protein